MPGKSTLPPLMKPDPTPVETPKETKEQPTERKAITINNEVYYWDEVSSRAHIIQRSAEWLCLYDTKLKLRFFKKKENGECQLDKPSDFDTNIEVR